MSKKNNKKKKVEKIIKLQIPAGKANPAPPVGPALGAAGVNIMAFCQEFNKRTQADMGNIFPVVIHVYADKSIDFILKQPPASELIKKEASLSKGSGEPNKTKVGVITKEQVKKIAIQKMPDLNARDQEHAERIIEGTALSMGLELEVSK